MYFYHKGERLEMYRIALKISKKQNTQFEKNIIQGYGPQYVATWINTTDNYAGGLCRTTT